jgi:hypothetical protein
VSESHRTAHARVAAATVPDATWAA